MANSIAAASNDVVYTECEKVKCEGNGPATGHPLIYLNFGDKKEIECPYCSRRFVKKDSK